MKGRRATEAAAAEGGGGGAVEQQIFETKNGLARARPFFVLLH
jgi:hypothetical protein